MGGFIVRAIRSRFTPNNDCKQSEPQRPSAPPDLIRISQAVDQALMRQDRDWAVSKLSQLWEEGWQEQVQELCQLRRDWHFQLGPEGGCDADG